MNDIAYEIKNKKEADDILDFFINKYDGKEEFTKSMFGYERPILHIRIGSRYPSYSNFKWASDHGYKIKTYKDFLKEYKKVSVSKHVKQLQFESIESIKEKFKKGDRVTAIMDWGKLKAGKKGTVLDTVIHNYHLSTFTDNIVAVEWDEIVGGHDCDGLCKIGYGWNMPQSFLKEISKSKHVKQLKFESYEPRLKIGDKVKIKNNHTYSNETGTIIDEGSHNNNWWYGVKFDRKFYTGAYVDFFKINKKHIEGYYFTINQLEKINKISKYVKQLKFESQKEKYTMDLNTRLEKLMMKDKVLKEESYELTVKKNEAPKIAPILTNLKNVTITKSFDLNDLERHRFMIATKVDPFHIEDMLKDELTRKRIPVNVKDIKISVATPKSLEEELKEDK